MEPPGLAAENEDFDDLDRTSQLLVRTLLAGQRWGELRPPVDAQTVPIRGPLIARILRGDFGPLRGQRVRIHGALIVGDLDLSYLHFQGELDFRYSRIEGIFDFSHTTLTGSLELGHCELTRLQAARAVIDGALRFDDGKCAAGIYANGIRITGPLVLRRTEVTAPTDKVNQCALELFRAQIGDVFLTGATLRGGLYANAATIGQHLRLMGTVITSREALGWETGPDSQAGAVSLAGAVLGGNLALTQTDPSKPDLQLHGALVLSNASCSTFRCRSETLTKLAPKVDHFTFKRLVGTSPSEWLLFLDQSEDLSTHSYVHLARYCAELGRADLERVAHIALQNRITGEQPRRSRERIARNLWAWSVAYGYRPGRALIWLATSVLVSWLCLGFAGDFLVHEGDESTVRGTDGWGHSLAMSLDYLLPFADLGVADGWRADAVSLSQGIWLGTFTFLKFVAWGSAAAGLAALTGLMKRG